MTLSVASVALYEDVVPWVVNPPVAFLTRSESGSVSLKEY